GDVAVGGAGLDLHRLLTGGRPVGGVEGVVDPAEGGVEVEPGGDAVPHADVDRAERRLRRHGAGTDLAEADVAAGGLDRHRRAGPADGDPAVGGVDPDRAADVVDLGVAVGVLDHERAVDGPEADRARGRAHVAGAARPPDGDVAGGAAEAQGARLFDLDVAGARPVPAVPEPAGGPQGHQRRLAAQARPRRQLDADLDRLPPAPEGVVAPAPRGLHPQDAVGVLHLDLFGGGDVGRAARVAGADVDHRVGAVGGGEVDVADAELQHGGDRFGRVEGGHGGSLSRVGRSRVWGEATVRAGQAQRAQPV